LRSVLTSCSLIVAFPFLTCSSPPDFVLPFISAANHLLNNLEIGQTHGTLKFVVFPTFSQKKLLLQHLERRTSGGSSDRPVLHPLVVDRAIGQCSQCQQASLMGAEKSDEKAGEPEELETQQTVRHSNCCGRCGARWRNWWLELEPRWRFRIFLGSTFFVFIISWIISTALLLQEVFNTLVSRTPCAQSNLSVHVTIALFST
jgi:hypothetical protein